jgi:hypothetical protein
MTTETTESNTPVIRPGDRGTYKDSGLYTGYEQYDGERIEIVREYQPKDLNLPDDEPANQERLFEAFRRDRPDGDDKYTLMVFGSEFIPNP